jgi:hypothetical protein
MALGGFKRAETLTFCAIAHAARLFGRHLLFAPICDHFLRHKKNPPSFGKGEFGLVCEVDAKGENGFPLDFALVIPEAVRKA